MGAKQASRKRTPASKGKGKEQAADVQVKQELPSTNYALPNTRSHQDATTRMESIQEGSDSDNEVERQLLRARMSIANSSDGNTRPATGQTKRRVEMAKTSRLLKNRLALAFFKVGRGWESVGFDRIESQYGEDNGQIQLTEEAANGRKARANLAASSSSVASSSSSSFPASHPAPVLPVIASSAPTPSSSRVSRARAASQASQVSAASPKLAAATSAQARPQISRHNSLATIDRPNNASSGVYATAQAAAGSPAPAQQQQQYSGRDSPSAASGQPIPMSAPASVTSFQTSGGPPVESAKKPRQRRESHQPKSATKRAAASAPDGEGSSHKRKPSQNTLWQNSRAILGAGIGGQAASSPASPVKPSVLAAMTAATPSPQRHPHQQQHPNYAAMQQASQEIYARAGSSGQAPGTIQQTPRRNSGYQNGGPPQSVPHSASHQQYIPHQPSNLNPSPAHVLMQQQHIATQSPNVFVSPQYVGYPVHTTPQQQQAFQQYNIVQTPHHPQSIQHQQQLALSASNPDFSGSIPQYATTDGLAAFSYPMHPMQALSQQGTPAASPHNMSPYPVQQGMLMQQQPQQAQMYQQNDLATSTGRNRSQSGLSRTPSDLSYAGSQPPPMDASNVQLSSSQESSSLDTNLSVHIPSNSKRPTTASGADQESAAELMLFLAHSPSPKQSTKKSGQNVLGGDLKGRRLFGSEEDLAGNGGNNLSNGTGSGSQPQSLDMATFQNSSNAGQNAFVMHHSGNAGQQLQGPGDMYASAAGDLAFSQQLDQPFEFQQVGPGEPFHFSQYGLMDGQAPLSLGQDYGAAW